MNGGGTLPAAALWQKKQDRPKAQKILDWFNAMATEDEKKLLKPSSAGDPYVTPYDMYVAPSKNDTHVVFHDM